MRSGQLVESFNNLLGSIAAQNPYNSQYKFRTNVGADQIKAELRHDQSLFFSFIWCGEKRTANSKDISRGII